MDIFQTVLPRIFAERLDSDEAIARHVKRLGGNHHWDENRQAIIRVSYRSGYGDSVDEVKTTVAHKGLWAIWASSNPSNFYYVSDKGEHHLSEDEIPKDLLNSLWLEVKPLGAAKEKRPAADESSMLW